MKHEWRKDEKEVYVPKSKPVVINVPQYQFLTIEGEGNPNSDGFSAYIAALYAVSYAVKMNLKKESNNKGYYDYTVYPLEGVWDINEDAKNNFDGVLNKDDLVFKLMIRQPDFVENEFIQKMIEKTKTNKKLPLLDQLRFEKITEGKCVQMMHIGSYDDEPKSFTAMEAFAENQSLSRTTKVHREIYLSDFRKVAEEKLKTVLRFKVN